MIRAYFREASFESSSDLAPVTTILPEAKMSAVVFGSRIRMITAAKRYRQLAPTARYIVQVSNLPLDCTQRCEHEGRSSSGQGGNRD